MSGDVTSQVSLWNAGTEIDQEPAVGDATGPMQPAPDFGLAGSGSRRCVQIGQTAMLSDGTLFALPPIEQMIKVTLTPGANRMFMLHVETYRRRRRW